jgi:hypothetical protein
MRFAILALAAFVALLVGPRVELASGNQASAVEQIGVAVLQAAVPGDIAVKQLSDRPGLLAMAYLARPDLDTMPILPDVPARAAVFGKDLLPNMDLQPPAGLQARDAAQPTSPAPDALRDVAAVEEVVPLRDVTPVRSAGKFVSAPKPSATISGNRLALRTGPAKRFPSVAALARGTDVRITGPRSGGYLPVQVAATGQAGWVFHIYVEGLE